MTMVGLLKKILPTGLKTFVRNSLAKETPQVASPAESDGNFGNYSTWEDARSDCDGYEQGDILNTVKNALLQVKNGTAVYERDSVLFDKKEYSEGLITTLLSISSQYDYNLSILDFGGSLGSTWFQNRDLLAHLKSVKWNIVEQPHFVEEGKRSFEDNSLKFYETIEGCLKENEASTMVLSSVIQYLPDPDKFLEEILTSGFKHLIFDRTAFIDNERRICKQVVPESIYKASYPIIFFNESQFLEKMSSRYTLKKSFASFCDYDWWFDDGAKGYWKGFHFELKD